jgi:hypothetical protein
MMKKIWKQIKAYFKLQWGAQYCYKYEYARIKKPRADEIMLVKIPPM